ncbi:MAG: hypothetical protein GC150_16565 [Rhizobiales bacterium]|nr:hypothetical protein [Hyphomicrobiales bacterium]
MSVTELQAAALMECVALRILAAGAKGVGRRAIIGDLERASGGGLRREALVSDVTLALGALEKGRKVRRIGRARFVAEPALARSLGLGALSADWREARDVLIPARALGLSVEEARAAAAGLKSVAGLQRRIVSAAFGLDAETGANMSLLRNALAKRALAAAFGERLDAALDKAQPLPADIGRALASELAQTPRPHASDAALIAQLASEQAGAEASDAPSLRQALIARLLSGRPLGRARRATRPRRTGAPGSSRRADPAVAGALPIPELPDKATFDAVVLALAREHGEGWRGNRKAYVSHVWEGLKEREPAWGMDEATFKEMLAAAHREGRIVLVNADLRTADAMPEIQASAVRYRNAEWHFIRVIE